MDPRKGTDRSRCGDHGVFFIAERFLEAFYVQMEENYESAVEALDTAFWGGEHSSDYVVFGPDGKRVFDYGQAMEADFAHS